MAPSDARLPAWLGVERVSFDAWREAFESRGIVVMQLRLGSGGLRGFSLADEFAPLVAVNTAENLEARIFSLLHELAHLSSSTETACLEGVGASPNADQIERWCDSVASAAVLPRAALRASFAELADDAGANFELVRLLAARFGASLRATAVALIGSGLADSRLYEEVEQEAPTSDYEKGFARGRGQRAPQRRLGEVGPRAAAAILSALSGDRLTEREARQYLRLDGAELSELAEELGSA